MGIVDVGEKIVVIIEEPNVLTKYVKTIGADVVSYTPYIEEALTFMCVKTAGAVITELVSIHKDLYRHARGSESFDDTINRRTIAAARINVTRTPLLSTVIIPKGGPNG